jgi:hypothetical protein
VRLDAAERTLLASGRDGEDGVLRIRKEEKEALAAAEERAFEQHVATILRAHWPEAVALGDDGLGSFIHTWIAEARLAGVRLEKEVAHFVNIMFAVVTDLDQDPRRAPWVREVVNDEALTPTGKIYELYVRLYRAYEARGK